MAVPAGEAGYSFKRVAASQSSLSGTGYFFSGSRTSSTAIELYENGSSIATTATADSGSVPTTKMCSGAYCPTDSTSAGNAAMTDKFMCFGGGLTDAEHSTLYTLVHAYQTALGRNSA
jgi:hypothetical protein